MELILLGDVIYRQDLKYCFCKKQLYLGAGRGVLWVTCSCSHSFPCADVTVCADKWYKNCDSAPRFNKLSCSVSAFPSGSKLMFVIPHFSSTETTLPLCGPNHGVLGSAFFLPATSSQSITNLHRLCLPPLSIGSATLQGVFC